MLEVSIKSFNFEQLDSTFDVILMLFQCQSAY